MESQEIPEQYRASKEDIKRLRGIREFDPIPDEQKQELLGSSERLAAFESIDTSTNPREIMREFKKGVALELLKQKLVSSEVLRSYPLVYIGSGVDIEYPLALGAREIEMVDPMFNDENVVKEVVSRIEALIKEIPTVDSATKTIRFNFDFGEGKEEVKILLVPFTYSEIPLPDQVGVILSYANFFVQPDDEMKSRIVEGGAIVFESQVIQIDSKTKEEKETELGR